MAPSSTFKLKQNMFHYDAHGDINVHIYQPLEISAATFQPLLDARTPYIGVSADYGDKSVIASIALAAGSQVVVVHLSKITKAKKGVLKEFLSTTSQFHTKAAFHMDRLVAALHFDLRVTLSRGLDLLSGATAGAGRDSLAAMVECLGGETEVQKFRVEELFFGHTQKKLVKDLAMQAWAAWWAASLDGSWRFRGVALIDSTTLPSELLSRLLRDADRLEALKPTAVQNEIASDHVYSPGDLQVTCTRFKNRIRSDAQRIEVRSELHPNLVASGRVSRVDGRSAQLNVHIPRTFDASMAMLTLTTIGKEAATSSERQRAEIVLAAFKGTSTIVKQLFFKALWLPEEQLPPPVLPRPTKTVPIVSMRPLNPSQRRAVTAILSPSPPVILVQGPPGTGKTTVIAAAVTTIRASASMYERSIYCIAQSNVAVKNIAEKLASVDFLDFKLIVSKDFHYDWHEHLYQKIEPNVLRTDHLEKELVGVDHQLAGSRVILCTLSMLSNPQFAVVTRIVPLETVIVDEASQIEIGDFLPMISLYSTTIEKLVFVGDEKQLAPYGQGQIDTLRSVFEMKHLRTDAIFLDTQYRMPKGLGSFIGLHVYDDKLKSEHRITGRCWQFVDVQRSEELSSGRSWINIAEVKAVVAEAGNMQRRGRSYRIITPYDAQRAKIEAALRAYHLDADDKVFCVDSFQGNEDDHILLSLVRTSGIGFMNEQRRVNVMLTRCKKTMTVFTSKAFILGPARETLVGKLAACDCWR
ncbi:hypothetical protein MKEN_00371600 [Mycena kentingensis (nom. inval.)]|nr:hypothetical protein MKEN_00371600 [Mycena kentingensis (nom. inval.)]